MPSADQQRDRRYLLTASPTGFLGGGNGESGTYHFAGGSLSNRTWYSGPITIHGNVGLTDCFICGRK